MGDAAIEKIDDATVYRYASYRYIHGEDPTKINFEHPPFGKYIMGFSWLIFGNMTVINFLIYIACLLLFWCLTKLVLDNYYFRVLALFLLGTISLIPYYVFQSMLDVQLLFFTLLFFSSIFLIKNHKLSILTSGISLGAYSSVKYYFPTVFLFLMILFFIFFKRKKISSLLYIFIIAIVFYLLTYIRYFFINPNPLDFIRFEWYRFRWWTGDRSMPKFLLLGTIFLGRFKAWWAENLYEISPNWSVMWPFSFIVWLFSLFSIRKNKEFLYLFLFSLLLLLMYLFGAAANERYLIQLIPFWILGLVFIIEKYYFKLFKSKIVSNSK